MAAKGRYEVISLQEVLVISVAILLPVGSGVLQAIGADIWEKLKDWFS
jgi:hypothetical protein